MVVSAYPLRATACDIASSRRRRWSLGLVDSGNAESGGVSAMAMGKELEIRFLSESGRRWYLTVPRTRGTLSAARYPSVPNRWSLATTPCREQGNQHDLACRSSPVDRS